MELRAGMTAVITGAASGIGLALARGVADRGLNVVLADRDEDRLAEASASLGGSGDSLGVVTDVADPASVTALAEAATARFGPIHLLANNAGILRPGTVCESPLEDFRSVFDVNVFGILHGCRAFVPGMLAHGQPCHVVNTASFGGFVAAQGAAPYTVSKHAVVALSECLASENADTALGVTVLCPGGAATDIFAAEQRRRQAAGITASTLVEERFARIADPSRNDMLDPADVAGVAIESVEAGELYAMVFPAGSRDRLRQRLAGIERAMQVDEARKSPVTD